MALAVEGLKFTESGAGVEHQIHVEIPGKVRVGFENGMGYGLTQWFDLAHDPEAKTDLAHNPVIVHPGQRSQWPVDDKMYRWLQFIEQGSLINTVYYTPDWHSYIVGLKDKFKNLPRSCAIIEKNAVRVVLESRCVPTYSTAPVDDAGPYAEDTARYHIYANGRILARTTSRFRKEFTAKVVRYGVIGLGDPTFFDSEWSENAGLQLVDSTHARLESAGWTPGVWKGRLLRVKKDGKEQKAEILGNTEDVLTLKSIEPVSAPLQWCLAADGRKYGWLRSTNEQDPFVYTGRIAKYIFVHWDKTTPAPWTDWSHASVLLVPHPNQKYDSNLPHNLKWYKRHDFQKHDVLFEADKEQAHLWMMQLGTEGDALLPDIASIPAAARQAKWYEEQMALPEAKLDPLEGTYDLQITSGKPVRWTIPAGVTIPKPVLAVRKATVTALEITINGQPLAAGELLAERNAAGDLLVLLAKDLEPSMKVEILAK